MFTISSKRKKDDILEPPWKKRKVQKSEAQKKQTQLLRFKRKSIDLKKKIIKNRAKKIQDMKNALLYFESDEVLSYKDNSPNTYLKIIQRGKVLSKELEQENKKYQKEMQILKQQIKQQKMQQPIHPSKKKISLKQQDISQYESDFDDQNNPVWTSLQEHNHDKKISHYKVQIANLKKEKEEANVKHEAQKIKILQQKIQVAKKLLQQQTNKSLQKKELVNKLLDSSNKGILKKQKRYQKMQSLNDQSDVEYLISSESQSDIEQKKDFKFPKLLGKKEMKKYYSSSNLYEDVNGIYDNQLRHLCRRQYKSFYKRNKKQLSSLIKTQQEYILFSHCLNALKFYSHVGDKYINNYLRNDRAWKNQKTFHEKMNQQASKQLSTQEFNQLKLKAEHSIKLIDFMFEKYATTFKEPIVLYRGSSLDILNLSFFNSVCVKGYISCSFDIDSAKDFTLISDRVETINLFNQWHEKYPQIPSFQGQPRSRCCFLRLYIEPGTPMIDINEWKASEFPGEKEILLPDSLYFTLCSIFTPSDQKKSDDIIRASVLVTNEPIY